MFFNRRTQNPSVDAGKPVGRSQLLDVIREAVQAAQRQHRSAAVLMLCLKPKDRLNLLTQDQVQERLEAALARLPALLRPADLYCVVNAGQVCIVLPDLANAAQALLAAYKLSRGMHEAAADTPGEPWVRPLIGIACFPDQAEEEAVAADASRRGDGGGRGKRGRHLPVPPGPHGGGGAAAPWRCAARSWTP